MSLFLKFSITLCLVFVVGCASSKYDRAKRGYLKKQTFDYSAQLRQFCLVPWFIYGKKLLAHQSLIAEIQSDESKTLPADHELSRNLVAVSNQLSKMEFDLIQYRPKGAELEQIERFVNSEKQVARCPALINTTIAIRHAEMMGAEKQNTDKQIKEYVHALQSTFLLVMQNSNTASNTQSTHASLEAFTYYGFDLLVYVLDLRQSIGDGKKLAPSHSLKLDSLKTKIETSRQQLNKQGTFLKAFNIVFTPKYQHTVENKVSLWEKKLADYSQTLSAKLFASIEVLRHQPLEVSLLDEKLSLLFSTLVGHSMQVSPLRTEYYEILSIMAKANQKPQ